MRAKLKNAITTLLVCLVVAACQWSSASTLAPTRTSHRMTEYPFRSTQGTSEEKPAKILTLTPTTTPTVTVTRMPTSTVTLTPDPSSAPDPALPTLEPTQAKARVTELFQTNGGCPFPCWWGILPGKSTWKEAERIVIPFASSISQGGIRVATENDLHVVTSGYSLVYPIDAEEGIGVITFSVRNNIIEEIHVLETGTNSGYALGQLLQKYGTPEEIFLSATPRSLQSISPFRLVLMYPQQGFLAMYQYNAYDPSENQPIVKACPNDMGPELWFWSPENRPQEAERLLPLLLGTDPANPLQPLEQVTDWTVERNTCQCFTF